MPKKILIVDDDCNFVQKIMNLNGITGSVFSVADSLKRANDLLLIDHFDLVIANTKVPGGNSLSLKNFISSDTRICFISGLGSEYNKIKECGELCYHKYELNNQFEVLFSNV
jgi:DNA-binding response OmpR family regulator